MMKYVNKILLLLAALIGAILGLRLYSEKQSVKAIKLEKDNTIDQEVITSAKKAVKQTVNEVNMVARDIGAHENQAKAIQSNLHKKVVDVKDEELISWLNRSEE